MYATRNVRKTGLHELAPVALLLLIQISTNNSVESIVESTAVQIGLNPTSKRMHRWLSSEKNLRHNNKRYPARASSAIARVLALRVRQLLRPACDRLIRVTRMPAAAAGSNSPSSGCYARPVVMIAAVDELRSASSTVPPMAWPVGPYVRVDP